MMLMIFSITTSNALSRDLIDLKNALLTPPPQDKRFKLVSGDWILSNGYREKEIKNKLFSCKERLIACDKYKEMALDVRPEVKTYLFKNPSWVVAGMAVTFTVGFSLGAILFSR